MRVKQKHMNDAGERKSSRHENNKPSPCRDISKPHGIRSISFSQCSSLVPERIQEQNWNNMQENEKCRVGGMFSAPVLARDGRGAQLLGSKPSLSLPWSSIKARSMRPASAKLCVAMSAASP